MDKFALLCYTVLGGVEGYGSAAKLLKFIFSVFLLVRAKSFLGCYMLSFKKFCYGNRFSNTYLVWDNDSREASVIDCGNRAAAVSAFVLENGLTVNYVILTHVHYDHVLYIDEFRNEFSEAAVAIGEKDAELLSDTEANVSYLFGDTRAFGGVDTKLFEGDKIYLGSSVLSVLNTPGHTPGGICIYAETEKLMFTGDTLFAGGGIGRTDFKYGDFEVLRKSLFRILSMDGNITIFPGHGDSSKIKDEQASLFY